MTEIFPDEFIINYEVKSHGYLFNLRLENNQLFLKQFSNGSLDTQESLTPPEDEWNDFWYVLNEIDVWKWYDEYLMTCNEACMVEDEWEVNIVWDGRIVESHGSDSYPQNFRDFLKAVEELTGILIEFIHED